MSKRHRRKLRWTNYELQPRRFGNRTYYITNLTLRLLLHQRKHPVQYPVQFDADGKVRPTYMGIPIRMSSVAAPASPAASSHLPSPLP